METYTEFAFLFKLWQINTKLWNDSRVYLTDDLYYKIDQNREILASVNSVLDHG